MSTDATPTPEPTPAAPGLPYIDPIPFGNGVVLGEHNLDLVAGFTCARPGHAESPYEQDVSGWLTNLGGGGAREAIRLGLAEVRLYLHADGRLIGFAAIGPATWELADGKTISVCLLHCFGVHRDFRYQPDVPRESRYGRRILGGVVEEVDRRGQASFFALYVDPSNPAQELYAAFGFRQLDVWLDPENGNRPWARMVRPIR